MSESKTAPQPRPSSRSRSIVIGAAVIGTTLGLFAAIVSVPTPALGNGGAQNLQAGQPTVTLEIPEVGCAGCSLEVRRAVKGAGGVVRLGEGTPKNRLVVTYDPAPGRPEAYAEALRKAGFAGARQVARD